MTRLRFHNKTIYEFHAEVCSRSQKSITLKNGKQAIVEKVTGIEEYSKNVKHEGTGLYGEVAIQLPVLFVGFAVHVSVAVGWGQKRMWWEEICHKKEEPCRAMFPGFEDSILN